MKILNNSFVWAQVLILISLIGLYTYTTEIFHEKEYPAHVHKTLYLDRNFNDEEVLIIMQSAVTWTEVTNHIVELDVVRLPTHEMIDLSNSIIILKINSDYPEAIVLDGMNQNSTLGFYNDRGVLPYIALISERIDDYDYQSVVLHEIGHSLGLKHVKGEEGLGTLMYPTINFASDEITTKDLEQFCSLYHCDVEKLQH